jgi:hypothetical protein
MRTLIAEWKYPIALSFAACFAIFAWAQDSPGSKPIAKDTAPVSVQSFNQQKMPIGYLGHPLGTVVRVTGVCVDGATVSKVWSATVVLRVETVNGGKLKQPEDFAFPWDEKEVPKPKPQQRFDYYVHECGTFCGVVKLPKELEIDGGNVIGVAAPRFHFDAKLSIHRSLPVKQ